MTSDTELAAAGRAEEAMTEPVVVIADDDPDIRQLIAIAARRAGASVGASVSDGAAALTAIRELEPALAILDVAMPAMTGVQVARAVREGPGAPSTRLMLVSAAVQPAAVDEGWAAGADRYAVKPFKVKALAEQIRELLDDQVGRTS